MGKIKLKLRTTMHIKHKVNKPLASYSFFASQTQFMLENQLQKIKEGKYVPNQRYDSVRRTGQKTPLETAIDVTRGLHSSITANEPKDWFERESFGSRIREQEVPALEQWAIKNKQLIKSDTFNKIFQANPIGGAEHQVILLPGQNMVVKRRLLWGAENYYDSLQYLQEHNKIFPETAYSFRGFMRDETAVNNARLMPTYSQPLVQRLTEKSALKTLGLTEKPSDKNQLFEMYKSEMMTTKDPDKQKQLEAAHWLLSDPNAREAVNLSEAVSFMKAKGFDVIPDRQITESDPDKIMNHLRYQNKETGVIVSDLHQDNIVRDVYGDIYSIDQQLAWGTTQSERIKEALAKNQEGVRLA